MKYPDRLIIDGWQIEAGTHRIARDSVEVKLEPRSMELLLYLAARPGEVVTRAEIEEQVWQGRVVGYEAVSGAIAKIRKAFGDNGKRHRVIETIPKSGYRLTAPVTRAAAQVATINQTAEPAVAPSVKSKLIPAAMVLGIVVVCLAWWQPWAEPALPSIAVLPFENLSGEPEQSYFVDGFTDDLITDLSRIEGLVVISRNSTFTYKNKAATIRQVAEDLGVRFVMEGSVQRQDRLLRINVQLIDSNTDSHAWADRYEGNLDDLFSMRDGILRKIVTALSVKLAGRQLEHLKLAGTDSVEAHLAMLSGQARYQLFTPDSLVEAIPFLEKALELDSEFARAQSLLAAVYWGIYNNAWVESTDMSYEECLQKAEYHIARALKKPTPLAHRIAARWHEYFGRPDEAIIEAEKAIALDPNNPNGFQGMSALLVNQDRAEEGLEYIRLAMRLDPLSDYLWRLGYAQYHLERYADAALTLHRGTVRNPDFDWNYLLLAAAYGHLGREEEARQALARFNDLRINRSEKAKEFTLADLQYWSIKNEAGLNRLREGMRKAGVPEI